MSSAPRGASSAIALLLSLWPLISNAEPISPFSPRLQRKVQVARAGQQTLALDLELLAGAQPSLADLRLFDGAEREVPYLLLAPERGEPTWRDAGSLQASPSDKSKSGFEADLGAILRFDRVRVLGLSPPFMKRLHLEASGDRRRYVVLTNEATLFDLPSEGLRRLELEIPPGEFRYLRITWDDRGTSPVGLPNLVAVRIDSGSGNTAPLRALVPVEAKSSRAELSQWRIRLPAKGLPIVAVEPTSDLPQLLRPARISESRLENGHLESRLLGTAILRRSTRAELVAEELRVRVQPPLGNELLLTVENGNNPALTMAQATLELVPQPSVYFEAASAGTYVMRFGAKQATAPRYDLEAERNHLDRRKLAKAVWAGPTESLDPSNASQPVAVPSDGLRHGSPIDTQRFKYSRAIRGAGGGMTVLRLDAAAIAHSNDQSDLRIVDPEGRQVPFLVERETDPLVVVLTSQLLTGDARPKQADARKTYYRIQLPESDFPAARLALTTTARVFQREVSLLVEILSKNDRRGAMRLLAHTAWNHADPEAVAPALELDVPAGTDKNLLLAVEDGDNERLSIETTRLLLPARSLRFFHAKGEVLSLHYGDPTLGAPTYDLRLLSDELQQLPFIEANIDPERIHVSPKPGDSASRWFWAILVITVLGLLAMIARLVSKSATEPTQTP